MPVDWVPQHQKRRPRVALSFGCIRHYHEPVARVARLGGRADDELAIVLLCRHEDRINEPHATISTEQDGNPDLFLI